MTTIDTAGHGQAAQADSPGNAGCGTYARYALTMGWSPVPVWGVTPEGICGCAKGTGCPSPGKHPVLSNWQNSLTMSDVDTYATWDTATRPTNVGLQTGAPSGLWALDIDPKSSGDESLDLLEAQHGKLPATRTHRTGSGGLHYLFSMPDDFEVTNSHGRLPRGIDVRGNGGFIVAPASRSGVGAYSTCADEDVVPAPEWLLAMIRPQAVERQEGVDDSIPFEALDSAAQVAARKYLDAAVNAEIVRLEAMKHAAVNDLSAYRGEPWNQTVFNVSCNLVELAQSSWLDFDVDDVRRILRDHAPTDSGFTWADVTSRLTSAQSKVRGQSRPMPDTILDDSWALLTAGVRSVSPAPQDQFPMWPEESWNQVGNMKRTLRMAAGRLVWVPDRQCWYECSPSGAWAPSQAPRDDAAAKWCARAMEAALTLEVGQYDDEKPVKTSARGKTSEGPSSRDKFLAFMETSSKVEMHTAVSTQLRRRASDFDIEVPLSLFDSDPYAFACVNGLIDLRAGTIRGISPNDHVSIVSPVEYDPDMPIPNFERFMASSHPDPDVRDFLQKALGYSMFGVPTEQKMFIHHGATTANGKSVLMNLLSTILGDHYRPAPEKALIKQRTGTSRIGQDMVDLAGPRFLALNETNQGATLDGEVIKSVTAGDLRADRAHYSANAKYRVTGKIHLITNHLPHITADEAMARRLVVIPWTQSFENNPDPDLPAKLAAELPGILAWLVAGAVRWWADLKVSGRTGLAEPDLCLTAKSAYFEEEDEVGSWLKECCSALDAASSPTLWTPVRDLYQAYTQWRLAQGIQSPPMSANAFGRALTGKGHVATTTRIAGASIKVRPVGLVPSRSGVPF